MPAGPHILCTTHRGGLRPLSWVALMQDSHDRFYLWRHDLLCLWVRDLLELVHNLVDFMQGQPKPGMHLALQWMASMIIAVNAGITLHQSQ